MVLGLPRRPKGLAVPLETPKVRKNPDRSYEVNPQGDAVAILDSTGAVMVNYHYGVLLQTGGTMATTLGTLNPLT